MKLARLIPSPGLMPDILVLHTETEKEKKITSDEELCIVWGLNCMYSNPPSPQVYFFTPHENNIEDSIR